jgi:hypothetical protein
MGTITRSFANNITTSGVLLPSSLTNNSIANVTAYNSAIATGGMVLLSTGTGSASSSINFTTNINSTYKEYQFYFIDIHPRTDAVKFTFNMSTDSGSNYNVTKTSTAFFAYHDEADSEALITYSAANDLAQSTSFQNIGSQAIGSGADESFVGTLQLFNPASTTYVKHYISTSQLYTAVDYSNHTLVAGYGNTTSAVNAVQFKMDSGNFDGTILMYGIV